MGKEVELHGPTLGVEGSPVPTGLEAPSYRSYLGDRLVSMALAGVLGPGYLVLSTLSRPDNPTQADNLGYVGAVLLLCGVVGMGRDWFRSRSSSHRQGLDGSVNIYPL